MFGRGARTVAAFISVLLVTALTSACGDGGSTATSPDGATEQEFLDLGLTTDTSNATIDLRRVLSGGPAKDAIPALTEPEFVDVSDAMVPDDDVRGILLEIGDDKRYYPYHIMVWHEVVNDVVGGAHLAVTF